MSETAGVVESAAVESVTEEAAAVQTAAIQVAPSTPLPAGVITLMFTDIEGSSQLWERDAAGFRPAFDRHNAIVQNAVARWDGREVKSQGDSFMIAFERATSAIYCALDIQRALDKAAAELTSEVGELHVRIGLHTGEPFKGYDATGRPDYFGPMVNRAFRIADAGHGGQTLVSAATRDVVAGALSTDVILADLGHHRLRGLEQPEQIFEVRHPDIFDAETGQPRRFPPLRTSDALRSNLPVYSTSFVGRNRELPELCEILNRPDTRLLTVIGFGGMGKTRLALQLAERCSTDFPDGSWWVGLEEVRSAEAMIQRVAYHVGLHVQPEPSLREQLLAYLKPRQLLLVLDNVEQVPDAAGAIHDILQAAPFCKCVVTSRRALGLRAERIKEVLPLPPSDAANLFVDRACAQVAFELSGENAADVAELCRRVEGVPLAIELAASRVVTLSPREIARRLDERFKVLHTDAPDLPPRQRALRAAIDWSFGLLSPEDQGLFARLAVFAGGFTLEDAEAVCAESLGAEDETGSAGVMDGVARLRLHSLLRSEIVPQTQQTRYFMLEALRDYAGEKLRLQAERAEATFARHAEYFLEYAQEHIAHLRDSGAAQAIAEMESSFDNVRSAMDWSERHARWTPCARLALALGSFLQCRGFGHEALRRLQTGLAALERDRDELAPEEYSRLKAAILREESSIHLDHFDWTAARQTAVAAQQLFEAAEDARGMAQATNLLGLCDKAETHYASARTYFEIALSGFQKCNDRIGVALALNNLGLVEYTDPSGSPTKAIDYWSEALAVHHELEDKRGIAQVLTNLGAIAQEQGRDDDAWQSYLQALRWERELQHALGVARALSNLGEISQKRRQYARAWRFYAAAQCVFNKIGSPYQEYSRDLLIQVSGFLEDGEEYVPDLALERLKDRTLDDLVHWALAGDE
jgi:predicted ATPase/class 3 adenylate cyclase/Tfp pilus assembly protein PilF